VVQREKIGSGRMGDFLVKGKRSQTKKEKGVGVGKNVLICVGPPRERKRKCAGNCQEEGDANQETYSRLSRKGKEFRARPQKPP